MKVENRAESLVLVLESEHDTDRLGELLAALLESGDVVALIGTLGAGKTRFVRAFAAARGVDPDAVSSPTFVLIHEYEGVDGLPIYHFDTYRLDSPEAFEALGSAEYLGGPGISLIEWADRVKAFLPTDSIWLEIERVEGKPQSRRVTIRGLSPTKAARLLEQLD